MKSSPFRKYTHAIKNAIWCLGLSLNNFYKGESAWIILKVFNHNVVNFEPGQ
jgi:hypothetical protein